MSAEKRRKLATDTSFDGSRFFLELPREILIDEICSFLRTRDIATFFGRTCRRIRAECYTATSIFTTNRPLSVHIDATSGRVSNLPDARVIHESLDRHEAIPIAAVLCPSGYFCGERHLSTFKYVACHVASCVNDPRAMAQFLARYPAFQSASIHWTIFLDLAQYDGLEHPGTLQNTFPNVRTVKLHGYDVYSMKVVRSMFPRATIRMDYVYASLPFRRHPMQVDPCDILSTVQIGELQFSRRGLNGLHDEYRKCMQRTVEKFYVESGIPPDVADLLTQELNRRGTADVCYRIEEALPSACPAYAKYVTEIDLSCRYADHYLSIMHGFTHVRSLELGEFPHEETCRIIRLSMTTPDHALFSILEAGTTRNLRAYKIAALTPLKQPDMEYIITAICGMERFECTHTAMMDDRDAVERRVSQRVAAIRQRLPQTRDPAWRLLYKFDSGDPSVLPIEGYV